MNKAEIFAVAIGAIHFFSLGITIGSQSNQKNIDKNKNRFIFLFQLAIVSCAVWVAFF